MMPCIAYQPSILYPRFFLDRQHEVNLDRGLLVEEISSLVLCGLI